jgi:hypothetical protein
MLLFMAIVFNLSSSNHKHQNYLGNLLEMKIIGSYHRPTKSETLGLGSVLGFISLLDV